MLLKHSVFTNVSTQTLKSVNNCYITGALMSGLSGVYVLASLVVTVPFNYIYSATLDTYEGLAMLIGVAFLLPMYPLLW